MKITYREAVQRGLKKIKVRLNGISLPYCVMADEEKSMAEVLRPDLFCRGGNIPRQTKHGNVQIFLGDRV